MCRKKSEEFMDSVLDRVPYEEKAVVQEGGCIGLVLQTEEGEPHVVCLRDDWDEYQSGGDTEAVIDRVRDKTENREWVDEDHCYLMSHRTKKA